MVGVQVRCPEPLKIFCVYRPPSTPKEHFLAQVCEVLENHQGVPTCVLGDFNEDLMDKKTHTIHTTMIKGRFKQHISGPTTDYGSTLDHIYTKHVGEVKTDVVDCYYSDHDATYCVIPL